MNHIWHQVKTDRVVEGFVTLAVRLNDAVSRTTILQQCQKNSTCKEDSKVLLQYILDLTKTMTHLSMKAGHRLWHQDIEAAQPCSHLTRNFCRKLESSFSLDDRQGGDKTCQDWHGGHTLIQLLPFAVESILAPSAYIVALPDWTLAGKPFNNGASLKPCEIPLWTSPKHETDSLI